MPEASDSVSSVAAQLSTGELTGAISQATAAVKQAPGDTAARLLLAELLCLAGEFERADNHFGLVATREPKRAVSVALLRQLLRAETARQDWHRAGCLPERLGDCGADLRPYAAAGLALRFGETERANSLLADAEALRRPRTGTCNGRLFDDFRDLDDTCGGFIEVLTDGGDYRWTALDAIRWVRFAAPRRPHHLLWREAELALADGAVGRIHVPAIYAGIIPDSDELRLGRTTDWTEPAAGPVRGKGQRCFLVGEECMGILDIDAIEFV